MEVEHEENHKRSKLPLALGLAVAVTIVMTIVSVSIYTFAGFYKLDLSRPGYEIEREDVFTNEATQSYDSTSPLSSDSVDKILKDFDNHVSDIDSYGDFSNDALSDENIISGR